MILSEILAKKTATDEEMIFVVKDYILKRTGYEVEIAPAMNEHERLLLANAYFAASEWYAQHRNAQ